MEKKGDVPPPYSPAMDGNNVPPAGSEQPLYQGQPPQYQGQPPQYQVQPPQYQGQPQTTSYTAGQPVGYVNNQFPQQPMYYQQQQYGNVIIQQPMPVVTSAPPQDHMGTAIFVTLCCFWPTGVIAIIKANDAKNAALRGDMAAANSFAQSAKSMINVSIIAGICSFVFLAIIMGVYFGVVLQNINNDYDY